MPSALLGPTYVSLLTRRQMRAFSGLPPPPVPTDPATAGSLGGFIATIADKLGMGELATGGLQLAVIGGAVAGFRYFGGFFLEYLKKQTVAAVDFDSRDESYSWILNWLNDQPYSQNASRFSVSTTITRAGQRLIGEGLDASKLPPVYFLPAPGIHVFMYKNRLLWLSRERPQPSSAAAAATANNAALERIQISTLGRSRSLLEQLVLDAQRQFIARDLSRTVVYAADQYGAWRRTRSRPKRPLSTIVIPTNVKSDLVVDAEEFLGSEQWYSDRGIPYRRGYLLYGTPGSGKTSFVYSLATTQQMFLALREFIEKGELGLNIYVVNLSNKSLTDDTLGELVTETPSRCILLIEDVDAAFVQRTKGEGSTTNNITFSGLLNAIDGVAAQEGRILCMTTNHIEKLDAALIRPGRIDVRVHFGNATQNQAYELFQKFYPSLTPDRSHALATSFAAQVPDMQFSMAHLQGFLMGHKQSPEDAVRLVPNWVTSHNDNATNNDSSTTDKDE
ncbi:BCS1 N terminal-domain-containing protein [Zychaea mexicana]|uniref:BCS1 N terminal-domain-containing protein n=1 Tax=Zychaea mexicana TaxID=64656 RepID=UPI0022FEB5F1|nr:BCS1 N terminal-domain-containing protein [Zychaea mexicana]KAI9492142.1 BCS1 N terminal-domain-containing protein [Zychaea mexicana]